MSLFQQSVIKKYLNDIDEEKLENGWKYYQSYFKDFEQQQKIYQFKEEQFQYPFLENLFDKCLGYKIDGANQNLFTEFKNVTDSKKADGAIKINGAVIAVIELKSTKTKDFKKIEEQAFGYKVSHPNCKYVVTSNFEKLRFYIENTVNYEEFDLFNLTFEDYKLLWICLSFECLSVGLPFKIREDSTLNEESISKRLYKDYSLFRSEIFNDIVLKNPHVDKLILLNKTQKLLDRFLFIFFAEDKRLLPVNSISKITKKWEDDIAFGEDKSLYSTFLTYFNLLNIGRPATKDREEIFAYNGGLFAKDELLDNLEIDSQLIAKHTKQLSSYDFESEVSVNILGHIFENSLTEIEEIQNKIIGVEIDRTSSKRKKDGVFYTPSYITKYIVENTVGKLCREKKEELEINEEIYTRNKVRSKKRIDNLKAYRDWLLKLTICDPACGSGAFLVQALDFLTTEHKYIDELNAAYHGASITFSDITSSILENNLYGVDINSESVELAKLSLWLRTAQKGRKLTSLNSNLKCGNSLVADSKVVGEMAFNWENEFPEVFNNGGFDIIIGNPPYVIVYEDSIKAYLESNYSVFKRNNDLYTAFCNKSIQLLRKDGVLGFITPNSFIKGDYFKKLRELFVQYQINSIVDFTNFLVFEDANVFSAIILLSKSNPTKDWSLYSEIGKVKGVIKNGAVSFIPENIIQRKLRDFSVFEDYFLIKDVGFNYWSVGRGKVRGDSVGSRVLYNGDALNDKDIPYIKGSNFNRYTGISVSNYLRHNYDDFLNENDIFRFSPDILQTKPKLIYRQTSNKLVGTIDYNGHYCDKTVHVIINKHNEIIDLHYVLGIFNSKLLNYLYSLLTEEKGRAFAQVKTINIKKLPFKVVPDYQQKDISELVKNALQIGKAHSLSVSKFANFLQAKFGIEKMSKKLQSWHELDFAEFLRELNHINKKEGKGDKLTKLQELEWMEVFEIKKEEAQTLKVQITKTEKQIDQMVYELYGLTQEEIDTIEITFKD